MNSEEKILEMLAEIKATQEKHGELLEKHGELLERHGELLERHGELLERHDRTLSDLQKTVARVAVTQENVIIPQIKLLAEGHEMLLQKLARKERVDALEDDVALLKTVIKSMSQRIAELEKAQ